MTTENNLQTEGTNQNAVDAAKQGEVTVESLTQKIKALEANFADAVSSRDKAKQKLRELEEVASGSNEFKTKYEELFTEKSKLLEQFETTKSELNSLKEGIKTEKLNTALTTALEAAGAKAIPTVMKLVDKSKIQFDEQGNVSSESIISAIKEVQKSDPILFGDADPKKASVPGQEFSNPGVKRASEAATEGAYEKELRSAKTQTEIQAVMRKYGLIQ